MTESRAALLTAAAAEFAQFGLHGARIKGVVARAGVNERMIYHHFGSKEGLYGAVMDDQRLMLAGAWIPILEKAAHEPPATGMRTALASFYDLITTRRETVALFMHEWLSDWHGRLIPTADQLPAPLRNLYERGQEEGTFRPDVPFETAYGVALGSLMAMAAFGPRFAAIALPELQLDREELRDQVIDQLIDGMSGPPTRP